MTKEIMTYEGGGGSAWFGCSGDRGKMDNE